MRRFTANSRQAKTNHRRGFTLVELLIVISIIGVLVALIMPAVNSAREAGRRAQCSNNLHQMALGCLQLEAKFGHLPTGGWSCSWAGEPDRGYGRLQPGGWHFCILPFIDQVDLHDMGSGATSAVRRAQGQIQSQTPVAVFLCPTRHSKLQAFQNSYSNDFNNINDPGGSPLARSDYAANTGSNFATNLGAANGANTGYNPTFDWTPYAGSDNSKVELPTGVIYLASEVSMASIKDGATYTYLIGERNLNVTSYFTGTSAENDQGWDQGYDYDTIRGTGIGYVKLSDLSTATPLPPRQDRAGVTTYLNFGSAHAAGFNMAFCDGAVRKMNYDIDPNTHMQLGNRSDGEPTQLQNLESNK